MKLSRSVLLVTSAAVALFLLGGGLAMRVGAGENSYQQVVLFSELLALVDENYVDSIDTDELLRSAYEGLLGGLDANGAYLSPEEVEQWKAGSSGSESAGPGFSVLKAGRALQVVAVDPGSQAEAAGVQVADQIRTLAGQPVRDLSLGQAMRLLNGEVGTELEIEVLHPADGFRRELFRLTRGSRKGQAYSIAVERGFAVLRVRDLERLPADKVAEELDHARDRGVEHLILDLRNVVDQDPAHAAKAAGLFVSGDVFRLRDQSGRLIETIKSAGDGRAWDGTVTVLVNAATAGSAEGLALLLQKKEEGREVVGEATYGLGARPKLYELDNGSGLLISSELWETVSGSRWNGPGVEPDEEIYGSGDDFDAMVADQLNNVLEHLEGGDDAGENEGEAEEAG